MAAIFLSAIFILVLALCINAGTISQPYDTIVIGLGASGVTAATTLARAGKRVLGLEAQNRIGGRVNTVPFGEGVVELGAEWIHGIHQSRVYDLAIQNNISVIQDDSDFKVVRSDGTLADQALVSELVQFCFAQMKDPPKDPEPLGHYITRKLKDYLENEKPEVLKDTDFVEQFLAYMNLVVNNYEASNDWDDVSALAKFEALGVVLDGDLDMSWHKYGYKTFFEILLNKYNNGPGLPTLETKLNAEVTQIAWPQEPARSVLVTCKDGAVYTAGSVIVTVSLGVLKERHSTLFSPELPQEKQTAIDKLSMGIEDKVILLFPYTWWPYNIEFLWRGEDKKKVSAENSWTTKIEGVTSPLGTNNSLTFWLTGNAAKLVETLPEDVVKRKCMELLRKFMPQTIPEPIAFLRSSWYTNPYTRGSYSYDDNLQVSQEPQARAHLAAPLPDAAGRPRVLFAGEATDETHFSTVHGASDTGYREATRLLATPHS